MHTSICRGTTSFLGSLELFYVAGSTVVSSYVPLGRDVFDRKSKVEVSRNVCAKFPPPKKRLSRCKCPGLSSVSEAPDHVNSSISDSSQGVVAAQAPMITTLCFIPIMKVTLKTTPPLTRDPRAPPPRDSFETAPACEAASLSEDVSYALLA